MKHEVMGVCADQLRILSPIQGSRVARRVIVVNVNESPKIKVLMDVTREQLSEIAQLNRLACDRSKIIVSLSRDLEQKLASLSKLREALATKPAEGSHTFGKGVDERIMDLARRVDALEKARSSLYIQGEKDHSHVIDAYSPASVGPFKPNAVVEDSVMNLVLAEKKGYCVISRSSCLAARIDRPDWKQVMADSHVNGMDWVRALGNRAADHYRRVQSKDRVVIPASWLVKLVNSGDGPTEYRHG